MKIAVLLATYNRRQKTLSCLESLERQALPEGTSLHIFLTDDNSADGTADAVKALYPQVNLFQGNGHLYWAGGMRHTWQQAQQYQPDFYLLVNDDTLLYDNALKDLLAIYDPQAPAICIGSTRDESSGALSYGGSVLLSKKRWKSKQIFSTTQTADCDFANANIMLVPAAVVEKIGMLSHRYTHSLADYDYCLTARKQGFSVKLAPGFLGSCIDDHGRNWKSQQTSLKERIQYLKSPKGLAYTEYLWFIRHHFPYSYPSAFVKLWMKTLFPVLWDRFKKQ